ncbi:MAG: SipW-dependent-type signal peptide-containing protein [Oscillospiraceae bacterium]|nr:SipW-dependent-type signal peptide-containing protein [Oscillospiraceae bacterium]
MNRKKLVALIMVLALAFTSLVGGTLAYFMDDDEEANVFTMGNVEIDLQENFDPDNANLQPGVNINKDVWVQNTGSNEAYVRVHIAIPSEMDNGDPNFDASRNFLHFNFDKDSVVFGQWSWLPEFSYGTGYGDDWNFYVASIPVVKDNPATTDVDETVLKPYNVYVVTYRSVLGSGEITGTDVITNVYLDKSVNATATKVKDENGEDVVASYTYFDNKGNSFTLTAEEAQNIQIKIIAEGAQTATFENAYDALNTAFGVPGTYNPWN